MENEHISRTLNNDPTSLRTVPIVLAKCSKVAYWNAKKLLLKLQDLANIG